MPRSVVVAHSDGAVREVIKGILQRRGHCVEVADSVSATIEGIENGGIDTLLVSLHLPVGGYSEVLDTGVVPRAVIVIGEQGLGVPPEIEKDQRVSAILVRPFSLQSLFDAVEACPTGSR